MTWVRLDDAFAEHPKIAGLKDANAVVLWLAGLAYCNRNLTDGFIPHWVAMGQLWYCDGNAVPSIHALERVGLWHRVDEGWQVHDYFDFQPSREAVEREREQKRSAGRAGGLAKAAARAVADEVAGAVADEVAESYPVPVPVPVPDPTPEPKSTPPRAAARKRAYPEAFEVFWKAYPDEGRRDKPKVYAAWERAVGRVSAELGIVRGADQSAAIDAITEAARRYAADPNRPPDKTKYAQGWLTGDRWNDAPLPSRNGPVPGARSNALAQQMRGSS